MYGSNLSGMAQAQGMDVPALKEAVYASVEEDVKSQLVILNVAKAEGIELEDADRQEFAESNGQTVEDAVAYFGEETLDEMALNQKVMKFMADQAVNTAKSEEETADESSQAADSAEAKETTKAADSAEAKETTKAADNAESKDAAKADEETTAAQ